MTIRAADLAVGFHADTKDFERGAKKVGGLLDEIKMETAANIASEWVMKLGGAVKDFAVNLVTANANAESLRLALDIAANSAERGGKLFEAAQKMAAATPFELPDILTAMRQLEVMNIDSQQMIESIGNVAAATNTSIADAASAFTSATMGEYERLKAYGIKATVEGEKVLMTYMTSAGQVTKELEKGNQAAMASFLNDYWGERFEGAMEKQSQTLNGMLSTLKDNWNLTMQEMGKPIFELAKKVVSALNNIFAIFNKLREKGVNVVQALWTAIRKTLKGVLGKDNPLFQFMKSVKREIVGLTNAFREGGLEGAATKLFSDMLSAFQKAWPSILSFLEQATPKILAIIVNLMTWMPRHIIEHGPALLQAFVSILPGVINWLTSVFIPGVVNGFKQMLGVVYQLILTGAQGWLALFSTQLSGIVTYLSTEGVPAFMAMAAEWLGNLLLALVNNLPAIVEWFKTDFMTFMGTLVTIPTAMFAIGGAIIGGLVNGLIKIAKEQLWPWFLELAAKLFIFGYTTGADWIVEMLKGLNEKWTEFTTWLNDLGMKAANALPSDQDVATWFNDVGNWMIGGLISGAETKWAELKAWVTTKKDEFVLWFKEAFGIASPSTVMAELAWDIVYGLRDGFQLKWEEIKTNIQTLIPELVTWIKDALHIGTDLDMLIQIGKDIVMGMWNGITNQWKTFVEDIQTKMEELPWAVRKLLGIESPSKVFAEIGRNVALGLAQGVDEGWRVAAQSIDKMGDEVVKKSQEINNNIQKNSGPPAWKQQLSSDQLAWLKSSQEYRKSHRNGAWRTDVNDIEFEMLQMFKENGQRAALRNFKADLKKGINFLLTPDGQYVNQWGLALWEDGSSANPSDPSWEWANKSMKVSTDGAVESRSDFYSGAGGGGGVNITFNIDGVTDSFQVATIVMQRLGAALDTLGLGMQ